MPFFRRPKHDVVVVAVRYQKPGQIGWVRAYERRGPTWSDRKMIQREDLMERIRSGERVVTGERIVYEASNFQIGEALRIEQNNGTEVILAGTSGSGPSTGDDLADVPIL